MDGDVYLQAVERRVLPRGRGGPADGDQVGKAHEAHAHDRGGQHIRDRDEPRQIGVRWRLDQAPVATLGAAPRGDAPFVPVL